MTDAEKIMNSGELYQVEEMAKKAGNGAEYLQKMARYNSLGYGEEEEQEKRRLLKEMIP